MRRRSRLCVLVGLIGAMSMLVLAAPPANADRDVARGGDSIADVALRVTSTFRREDGVWKLVHRHADPITNPQAAESVIQR